MNDRGPSLLSATKAGVTLRKITANKNKGFGLIVVSGSNLTIADSKFQDNRARGDANGGALSLDGSDLSVNNTSFTANLVVSDGGAIFMKVSILPIAPRKCTDTHKVIDGRL